MFDETKKIARLYNDIKLQDFKEYLQIEENNIYHYTSPEAFKIIISDNTLRFSDRLFLNDKSEGSHVLDVCLKIVKEKLSQKDDEGFYQLLKKECEKKKPNPEILSFHTYQISFSMDKDNLALWNYYTKGDDMGGFNLKFNSEKLILSLKENIESDNPPNIYGGKVIYEEKIQIKIVENIISKFKQIFDEIQDKEYFIELLVRKILILGTFFKKDCFKFENEYRIVVDLYLDDQGKFKTIKNKMNITNKKGYMIPSIDIKWEQEALEGITLSPTLEYNGIKNSILNVTNGKYSNINGKSIECSQIPVRY